MTKKKITWNEKYSPQKCLKCGSREISAGDYDGDLWCEVTCDDCDFHWTEFYTFSHVEIPDQ